MQSDISIISPFLREMEQEKINLKKKSGNIAEQIIFQKSSKEIKEDILS
jgi:hypothetical protein